jgi:SAM-dependent methyltransferase
MQAACPHAAPQDRKKMKAPDGVETNPAKCRVCGSPQVELAGQVEYYIGFEWAIWDCGNCGCRFTRHEDAVYDRLHSEASSCYVRYRDLAALCKARFNRGDLEGLRGELSHTSKYRFVIDEVSRGNRSARLLEIGCARGFLTSYFILGGWRVTGVDVSAEAVNAANTAFGHHFVLADSPEVPAGAPYDLIYHVGTIGCVADPVGMTRKLLGMLKPGGTLLFNAPNREACWARNQLWFDSAPPPDVVTLFPPGFWRRQFTDLADVAEVVEMCKVDRSLAVGLRRLCRRNWRKPRRLALSESSKPSAPPSHLGDAAWLIFERSITRVSRALGFSRFAPEHPTEYGLFVRMSRI